MSYLYNDSEVKCLLYLIIKRDGPPGATELTHNLLFSCIPVFPWHKGKEEKLQISLCPYPTVLNLCQRGLQGPGVQDLHAWISHLSYEQVHDSASMSVDFSQAQVEKEKKKASCIPRRRLEAIHFPHKARGKMEEISETWVLPGAVQSYNFVFYFN